jgi:hypothetical protein
VITSPKLALYNAILTRYFAHVTQLYLQEYLVLHVFQRRLGLFMSLIQTSSFALCAHLHRLQLGEAHSRRIPRRWYMLLALCQSSAMALGNVGMMHLNYAAKVLFKSTKVSAHISR